jgi:hypothetical protein
VSNTDSVPEPASALLGLSGLWMLWRAITAANRGPRRRRQSARRGHQGRRLLSLRDWKHLYNRDIISMPDKWEYPWYAAWDLAFHMIPFLRLDPHFAKEQLVLMLREWYMHPNGQMPAYEFAFGDVNPPVHAWACWRVYKMTGPRGGRDRFFLGRVFQKLLINFTWWVNRKDVEGENIFSGGFLGLDNIGVFDRSQPLPGKLILEQADGTAWMAFYCLTMLSLALELAREEPEYEDVASKFFEHFVAIASAMNTLDENEFLSPYGIRSLSRFHEAHPYVLRAATARNGASSTSLPNPAPCFSAAIQTGAGRFGFR